MTPREKAEACFAKARSTTSEHERDNAITLGTRVAEKAGLSLDDFDIPGRVRQLRRQPGDFTVHVSRTIHFDAEALAELLRKMGESTAFTSRPRYCPHGSDMALFGESCVMCERERQSDAPPRDLCPKCGNERVQRGFFSVCGHCL